MPEKIIVDNIEYTRYGDRWHAIKSESTYVKDEDQKKLNEIYRMRQIEKREKRLGEILNKGL